MRGRGWDRSPSRLCSRDSGSGPGTSLLHGFRVSPSTRWTCAFLTPGNVAAFDTPGVAAGRAGFPQLGASVLLDVPTRQVRAVVLASITDSERRWRSADPAPQEGGFGPPGPRPCRSLGLDAIRDQEAHYVTRIPSGWKPRYSNASAGGLSGRAHRIRPVSRRQQGTPRPKPRKIRLLARLIEYKLPGSGRGRIRLMTSQLDSKAIPALEIAQLCHRRWDIEMAFDEIKTISRPYPTEPPGPCSAARHPARLPRSLRTLRGLQPDSPTHM